MDLGDGAGVGLELLLDIGAEEDAVVEHDAEEDEEADDDGGGHLRAPEPDEEETAGGGDGGVAEDDDRGDQPGAGAEVDQNKHYEERSGDDPAEGFVGFDLLLVAADPAIGGAGREGEVA